MKPMKQSFYTLSAAIFLSLCTACTEADIVLPVVGGEGGSGQGNGSVPDKGVPLAVDELELSLTTGTRAAGGIVTGPPQTTTNNPNPVKKVGIMVLTDNYSSKAYYDPAIPVKAFIYNEGTWVQDTATPDFYLGTEKGIAYPFAPSDLVPLKDGHPHNGYPSVGGIELKAAQTFRFHDTGPGPVDPATDVPWDTDQVDYLCGTNGTGIHNIDRWNPNVSFQLKHALAKVSFRVMEKDGGTLYAGRKVVKVELKSDNQFRISKPATPTDPGTVMDVYHCFIPDGSSTANSVLPAGSLTFTAAPGKERAVGSGETDPARVPVQAFGLVLEVRDYKGDAFQATAELTLDDGHVFTTSSFALDWRGGYGGDASNHYIYTLRLDPKGVTIDKPQVVGWDTTIPEQNVPVD